MTDEHARRGLGRGLSALLSDLPPSREAGPAGDARSVQTLPIELLRRNPKQPRRTFGEADLAELAESVKERGVLQPILVRPAADAPGEYQIVAGERRWRAAQRAGLHAVPVVVGAYDDEAAAEIAIIENVQRTDLNPLEEAQGYRALMESFGRTQETVARTVGKSRSHVANTLRLLNLPDEVREHVEAGRLTAGHARAIATSDQAAKLAGMIVDQGLTVRQAETLARPKAERRPAKPAAPQDADTHALEQDLSGALGMRVQISDRGGAGEVRIAYASLEQLDALCQRLG